MGNVIKWAYKCENRLLILVSTLLKMSKKINFMETKHHHILHTNGQSKNVSRSKHNERYRADCVFCNMERSLANHTWVKDLEFGSLFLNYNQSYKGRCLYIPFDHYDSSNEMDENTYEAFNKEIFFLTKALDATFKPELINIALLGNKIRHTHWHLIPRYLDDPNWGNPPWPAKEKLASKKELLDLRRKIEEILLLAE